MAKNPSAADRRQAARDKARQIAQEQAKREKTAKTILYSGVGVVVVAVVVIVGVLIYQAAQPSVGPTTYTAGSITLAKGEDGHEAFAAPDAEEGDVPEGLPPLSESGLPDTAPTVTVYLDFQCPGCKAFEDANGQALAQLVEEGTIALEMQPVSILDSASGGNQYSTRSANLMACVADSGQAAQYNDLATTLFANQPSEGASGMTDEELIGYAEEAGVDVSAPISLEASGGEQPQTVTECVSNTTFGDYVESTTQDALAGGLQGTPRVQINGEDVADWSNPETFMTEILQAAGEIG